MERDLAVALNGLSALLSRLDGDLSALGKQLAVANKLDADLRMLQAVTFLSNNAEALDLMQILGFADQQFFDATVTVAALATATAFTLNVPTNSVGFWRSLSITPDTSNQFSMQVLADAQQRISDPSLVQRTIIPESQWLPFYNTFVVKLTSLDAVGPHTAKIAGTRAFMQTNHWNQIKAKLVGAMQAVVGDTPYPSGVV